MTADHGASTCDEPYCDGEAVCDLISEDDELLARFCSQHAHLAMEGQTDGI